MEPGVAYSPIPSPAVAPTPSAAPQPPKRFLWAIVAAGVVIIVVALVAIWNLASYKKPISTISALPTASTSAVLKNSPAPVKRAGWEDYVDPANNFSISYPSAYKLETNYSESAFMGIVLTLSQPSVTASASAQVSLKIIYLNNSAKTAAQFATEQMKLEEAKAVNPRKFAGLDAFEIPLVAQWGRGNVIFVSNLGTVYRLSIVIAAPLNMVPTYQAQIDQILATFKILDYTQRGK